MQKVRPVWKNFKEINILCYFAAYLYQWITWISSKFVQFSWAFEGNNHGRREDFKWAIRKYHHLMWRIYIHKTRLLNRHSWHYLLSIINIQLKNVHFRTVGISMSSVRLETFKLLLHIFIMHIYFLFNHVFTSSKIT